MCMNNLSAWIIFSQAWSYILCVVKSYLHCYVKTIGKQLPPMNADHSHHQHHTEGHQPGKAEGLDLIEKAPMLHPGPGHATASSCTESSRLGTEEVSASSCLRTVTRWGRALHLSQTYQLCLTLHQLRVYLGFSECQWTDTWRARRIGGWGCWAGWSGSRDWQGDSRPDSWSPVLVPIVQ